MNNITVIKRLTGEFSLTRAGMASIVRGFHREMDLGLKGKGKVLAMIPTYVDRPSGKEKGRYIALDLGGTNFRVLMIRLLGNGRESGAEFMKFTLDEKHIATTGDRLFAFIAEAIKTSMKRFGIKSTDPVPIGFTFSFPVHQKGVASGTLSGWTKGFKASGVVGKDVVLLMNSALVKAGITGARVSALANDTVGTLCASGYTDKSCDVGVILGTGTNACYVEKVVRIKKASFPGYGSDSMIVNIEWGNFNELNVTGYDRELDRASRNPGRQLLEKMVSGMYLGELARITIKDNASASGAGRLLRSGLFSKPGAFKTEYMSLIESDGTSELSLIKGFLKKNGISSELQDRVFVKNICSLISSRAARISAAAMAAVIKKIDPGPDSRHTIAVDGTVYGKYYGFEKRIKAALKELLGKKSRLVRLVHAMDGSGKGAAIIAAVASNT